MKPTNEAIERKGIEMFTLKIETKNAAFADDCYSPQLEVARILRSLADKIEDGDSQGPVLDYNGNTVGHFALTGE